MTTLSKQLNDALKNVSNFVTEDLETTLANIRIILMGYEHTDPSAHISFYGKYQIIEAKINAFKNHMVKLRASLANNTALEKASRLLENQPTLHKKVITQLKILKHDYKAESLSSVANVMDKVKGNLVDLSGAIDIGEANVVNPLKTALAVPGSAVGILATIFEALAADEKKAKAATELALEGIVLQENAKATLNATVDGLQEEHDQAESDAKSMAAKVGHLRGLIAEVINAVNEDIRTFQGLKQTPLVQSKANGLQQLQADMGRLYAKFDSARDELAGSDLAGGALQALLNDRKAQAFALIQKAQKHELKLKETLLSFETYMLRKSDDETTGLTEALRREKITHRDSLLTFERALLKVKALDNVLTVEEESDVRLLDRRGNHGEEYQMKKLCSIEKHTHARVEKMARGFTGEQVQLFLFALIYSVRKESLHVEHVTDNYIKSVTTLISSVFRAFRADKKYGISRESYNNGFEVIQEMSKGGELQNLLKQEGNGKKIQTLFSTFNSDYAKASARLHGGGGTRP